MAMAKSIEARLESACEMMRRVAERQREQIEALGEAIADAQAAGQPTQALEEELAAESLSLDTLEQVIAENC